MARYSVDHSGTKYRCTCLRLLSIEQTATHSCDSTTPLTLLQTTATTTALPPNEHNKASMLHSHLEHVCFGADEGYVAILSIHHHLTSERGAQHFLQQQQRALPACASLGL